MSKTRTILVTVLAAACVGYGVWYYWSGRGLVTLSVRDADVREVARKIGRQARATLVCDSNMQGKVTFRVRRATLEAVLAILGDQTSCRWSLLYPLYSSGKSLDSFERSLSGEIDPTMNGWTNLQARTSFGGFGGRGGPGGFGGFGGPGGGDPRSPTNRISLSIEGKDVHFATLALNRFGQARIVPEDGTDGLVLLKLEQAKVTEAVAGLAKQARRDWATVYFLQGDRDRGREFSGRDGGGRGERGEDGDRRGRFGDWADMTDEERQQRRMARENLEKELTQTLPAAEQAKIAEQQQQREQMRQEFASMTDEQRQARFEQMRASGGGPGGFGGRGGGREQRMIERIKNTTSDQKVDRMREMAARRARWEQRQQGGGPGRGR